MDANAQTLMRVRELHRLFERRSIHHDGSAGEDAVFKALDDPGIDARRQTEIICIHNEQFCQGEPLILPIDYPRVPSDSADRSGYAGSRKIMPSSLSS